MTRLVSVLGSALVASLVGAAGTAEAQSGVSHGFPDRGVTAVARSLSGSIEGTVSDEQGRPLGGVTVSALGASTAVATSDQAGAFRLRALPPGPYLVRAHRDGYLASRRQLIDVRPGGASRHAVSLRRLDVDQVSGPAAPRLSKASLVLSAPDHSAAPGAGQTASLEPGVAGTGGADEVAWRLRHLPRSVLKDTVTTVPSEAPTPNPPPVLLAPEASPWSKAAASTARAASLVASLPLSAEVRLLTTGAFDGPDAIFSPAAMGNGIAYLSLAGPVSGADWSAQAVLSQGATGAWFLAGDYRRRAPSAHRYHAGFEYSVQRFAVGPRGSRLASPVGSRSALSAFGYDRWTIGPRLELEGGAQFARYAYLDGFGLLSPRVGVTVAAAPDLRVRALVAQRLSAPGAEEFLQPVAVGLWVPPGRTFVDVSRDGRLGAQQTRHFELSFEQDLPAAAAITVRAFRQQTRSQQVALFGNGFTGLPRASYGHYLVSRAGDLDAHGWSIGLTDSVGAWFRGAVSYGVTEVSWVSPPDSVLASSWRSYVGESGSNRFHDVTTSVETDIPYTATRVFVLYKLNSGFARADGGAVSAGIDTRFDVQVTQSLPFLDFTAAEWQVLVAVRNLFREAVPDGSVFDELLVVRPPKRVVGGVLVRF